MINKITLMDFLSLENRKQKKNERSRQSGKSHHTSIQVFVSTSLISRTISSLTGKLKTNRYRNDFFRTHNDSLAVTISLDLVTISSELATTL